jgi:hypothetical protein
MVGQEDIRQEDRTAILDRELEVGDRLKKTLTALQARNSEIEAAIGEARTEANAAANRAGE